MALVTRKALCETFSPLVQIKRFRGKINIQRPKAPHFERARYIELTKPYFISPFKDKTMLDLCSKNSVVVKAKVKENPFQKIIAQELFRWFESSRLVAFFHMNPMNSDQQFKAYTLFKKENMHFKNYGTKTLELAVKGTPYECVLDFYISRNMMVFSPEPELKKLLRISKKFPQIILIAAIYEGKLINKDEITYYSQIPNIQTAQSGLVQTINQIGVQLVSNLNSHQTNLVSNLESRVKQLETDNI